VGIQVGLIGLVADAVSMNRRMLEEVVWRARQVDRVREDKSE